MSLLINFTPYKPDEIATLAKHWFTLEQRVDSNLFLSWAWINSWLASAQSDLILVEALENKQIVGLALFTQVERKVLGIFTVKRWLLHRTGKCEDDQPWIEYNNFLAVNEYVQRQMADAVMKSSHWQELIIGMAERTTLLPFDNADLKHHIVLKSKGYKVDFKQIDQDYSLQVLSKNCRQKIKKNISLLENIGHIDFEIITDKNKILSRMATISAFHIERWQKTATKSGFENSKFRHFLQALINNECNVQAHLSCLKVGNIEVAYLLNFIVNQKVYFYLSAIDQKFEPMINKGIILHYQTVEYYYQQGYLQYDFLLGDHRFKTSLSTTKYHQQMKCYFKNSTALGIENILRKVKSRLIKQ